MKSFISYIFLISSICFGSGSSAGGGAAGSSGGNTKAAEVNTTRFEALSQKMKKDKTNQLSDQFQKDIEFDHNHDDLTKILKKYVSFNQEKTVSWVDYKNLDSEALKNYLNKISQVTESQYQKFSRNEKFSFLINAYNAFTLLLVKNHYPVNSIKDIGWPLRSPWKMSFFKIRGQSANLDKIEHEWIRGSEKFYDPRAHFALNCASKGCPALQDQAFTSDQLEFQLDQATLYFLKNNEQNRIEGNMIKVSSIFKWFAEDFENSTYKSLENFLADYFQRFKDNKTAQDIRNGIIKIGYLKYDWDLNEK